MWWITVSLILAGILFMLIEILLVPGVGIAGLFSLASLGASCWYSFTYFDSTVGWMVTVIDICILIITLVVVLQARTWKRFELDTAMESQSRSEVYCLHVGEQGIARTRVAPVGMGKFRDITVEIKSYDNSIIASGTPIEITEIVDFQAIVKPIKKSGK